MAEQGGELRVWRDLTQAELDRAYDQTIYAPNFAQLIKRFAINSAAAVARLGAPQLHKYGDATIETLLYYPARGANTPIHVHVHGGAWRQRPAKDMLFLAEPFVAAGVGFAIFDFVSVEETGSYLEPMVQNVRQALAWLVRHASELGGDPGRLSLSGFSSGSHLASAALVADWSALGFERIPYASAFLASGMYDLYPVSLSKRSEYVKFTPATIETLSAERHAGRFDIPTIVAVGSYETSEFLRQARHFAGTLEAIGKPARYLEAEGYNHYEVLESLANPYSPLGHAVLTLAKQRKRSPRRKSTRA
jgi:arylformamidase